MLQKLLVAAILAGTASAASAVQTWNISYQASAGTLTGQVVGTLQGDANSVVISGVTSAAFNGVPGPALPFLVSLTSYQTMNPSIPVLTLDGSIMDFLACTDSNCTDGFLFGITGVLAYSSGISFGAASEPFNVGNWSMSAVGGVPEPASWAMLIAGFGLVGAVARRRRETTAAA